MLRLIPFFMTFFFINDSSRIQEPLQFVLNMENLENIIKDESKDLECLPIVIVTNGIVPLDMNLTMFGQKVHLVEDKEDSYLIKKGYTIINIIKSKVKSKPDRAEFDMIFNDTTIINVKLEKENVWAFKSFYSKLKNSGYKSFSYDRNF